jgi:hypothetical protein
MRVHCPPPNSVVRKKSEGWNRANPLSARRMSVPAVIQWLIRAPVV